MAYLEKITKNGRILGFDKSFWTRDELAFFKKHEDEIARILTQSTRNGLNEFMDTLCMKSDDPIDTNIVDDWDAEYRVTGALRYLTEGPRGFDCLFLKLNEEYEDDMVEVWVNPFSDLQMNYGADETMQEHSLFSIEVPFGDTSLAKKLAIEACKSYGRDNDGSISDFQCSSMFIDIISRAHFDWDSLY